MPVSGFSLATPPGLIAAGGDASSLAQQNIAHKTDTVNVVEPDSQRDLLPGKRLVLHVVIL